MVQASRPRARPHLSAARLATLLAVVTASGCATLRVGSDYDRDVSFAGHQTYAWLDAPEEERAETERVNPFIERRLRRAVDAELEAKGYLRSLEGGPADLLVSATVLDAEDAADRGRGYRGVPILLGFSFGYSPYFYPYSAFGYSWGYGRYRRGYWGLRPYGLYRPYFGYPYGYGAYGPYGYYGGSRRSDVERLAPGSFVIDILDGDTGELIWRGWANGALAHAPDTDRLPRFISATVHDILARFPPDARRR